MILLPGDANEYIQAHSSLEPPVLQALTRETWLKVHAPQMMASPYQGRLLAMISKMISPSFILDVGTFTGYSAICLAEGLKKDGKVLTIEINPELQEIATRYFRLTGLQDTIIQYIGDARTIIRSIDEQFDLVYIDSGKECYIDIYEAVMPKLIKGGFILADNALWYGKVWDKSVANDKDTEAIRRFNHHVFSDSRVENLIIPIEDGIQIIRKVQ